MKDPSIGKLVPVTARTLLEGAVAIRSIPVSQPFNKPPYTLSLSLSLVLSVMLLSMRKWYVSIKGEIRFHLLPTVSNNV